MKFLKLALWLPAVVNFWIFSRFTVDDSFITWRYGFNLVHHGIWNYNPSTFDPTQAYTNPVFAVLSIIPALLGINVVLFFKLLALLVGVSFIYSVVKVRPDSEVWLALFFAVPATIIHLFSGLETFVFVAGLFAVFVAVLERNIRFALIATSLVFLTRPEGWLLLVLVPVFLAIDGRRFNLKLALRLFAILAVVLVIYFAITFSMFGQILPNTFYVKSGKDFLWWRFWPLLWELALLLPLAALRSWRIIGMAVAFAAPVIYNYSTSTLAMDFASRYAFHLYAPFALLVIYVCGSRENRELIFARLKFIPGVRAFVTVGILAVSVGFAYATFASNLQSYETYYPRLLNAHGLVGEYAGKLYRAGEIHAMSISDAGLAPYLADISNLDTFHLGTHLGAVEGTTQALVKSYGVDFAALSQTNNAAIPVKLYLQSRGFKEICPVYLNPTYLLSIWQKVTTKDALRVCENSRKANAIDDSEYFSKNITVAPWSYWR